MRWYIMWRRVLRFHWNKISIAPRCSIYRVQKKDPYIFPYIWSINVPIFTIFDRNLPRLCSNKKHSSGSPHICCVITLPCETTKLWLNNAGVKYKGSFFLKTVYVVYTCQKSFDFIDAFNGYKQKWKAVSFTLDHPDPQKFESAEAPPPCVGHDWPQETRWLPCGIFNRLMTVRYVYVWPVGSSLSRSSKVTRFDMVPVASY